MRVSNPFRAKLSAWYSILGLLPMSPSTTSATLFAGAAGVDLAPAAGRDGGFGGRDEARRERPTRYTMAIAAARSTITINAIISCAGLYDSFTSRGTRGREERTDDGERSTRRAVIDRCKGLALQPADTAYTSRRGYSGRRTITHVKSALATFARSALFLATTPLSSRRLSTVLKIRHVGRQAARKGHQTHQRLGRPTQKGRQALRGADSSLSGGELGNALGSLGSSTRLTTCERPHRSLATPTPSEHGGPAPRPTSPK